MAANQVLEIQGVHASATDLRVPGVEILVDDPRAAGRAVEVIDHSLGLVDRGPPAIDAGGNSAWNIIRAFHLAGRCSGCDECSRACPADIRLDLINRKLELEVERQFGSVGLDPEEKAALVDFREDDDEEFVL